ncbi:MAG: hypothetical protein BWK79_03835 [Beggiatoa sp. IS2]|nr:MAG: hypothetical protein BWK79_03835 [Beggiatoa sp. IS2]
MYKIFVYGTLKKGKCNHFFLEGKPSILAIAPDIELHASPHEPCPFAIRGTGQTKGEVYEVDEILLQQLDELEGHPHDYCRELISVVLANGESIEAWIYLHPDAKRHPLIKDGIW